MASNFVLPSLTSWAKSHISAIIEATTSADLDSALDAFLTKDATFTVNGTTFSRSQYKTLLQQEKFDEIGATLNFSGEVEVQADGSQAGSVGLFYTAVVAEAIRIHDAAVQHQFTSSINLVIEQDTSIPLPTPPTVPVHGFPIVDRRRVTALNQVVVGGPVTQA